MPVYGAGIGCQATIMPSGHAHSCSGPSHHSPYSKNAVVVMVGFCRVTMYFPASFGLPSFAMGVHSSLDGFSLMFMRNSFLGLCFFGNQKSDRPICFDFQPHGLDVALIELFLQCVSGTPIRYATLDTMSYSSPRFSRYLSLLVFVSSFSVATIAVATLALSLPSLSIFCSLHYYIYYTT